MKISRRKFLKIVLGATAGATACGGAYSYFLEPYWPAVERLKLELPLADNPPAGLKIVQLSDIHLSAIVPDSYIAECIEKVNELKPDIVVLTGDYITRNRKYAASISKLFKRLQAGLGVYASLGNHDGGDWAGFPTDTVVEALEKAGVRVLINESLELEYGGRRFFLAGLGDMWAGQFEPSPAFESVPPEAFTIVLNHNPDTLRDLRDYRTDLVLCGHTHGGQVCIPLFGPPILPVTDRNYSYGLYREEKRLVYVNRGLGLLRRVRFNCRPEITYIEVTHAPEA
jgi:predicted MPP superfamily phosphohydrolase